MSRKRAKIDPVLAWLETVPEAIKVPPRDPGIYLSTSPWQVLPWGYELARKVELINAALHREQVRLPDGELATAQSVATDSNEWGYRNKMEFSFFGDESGLHLAFYRRGSHGKVICASESLGRREIWQRAREIAAELARLGLEARDLKTLILRASQDGQVVAKLFVKNAARKALFLALGGSPSYSVVFSDPKSPASVTTETWLTANDSLADNILGNDYHYNIDSFFQVNLPVYQLALKEMSQWLVGDKILDLYAGVGTIGLSIARDRELTLVEVSESAVAEMRQNAGVARVVLAKSEEALEYIDGRNTVIVDPPRAGLHRDLIKKLLISRPERIIYLSCNVLTQARDVKWLTDGLPEKSASDQPSLFAPHGYRILHIQPFNFFPKTPHILRDGVKQPAPIAYRPILVHCRNQLHTMLLHTATGIV